ncbi:tRNA (adenosine(37)-N6)-threonylcarbamoyltransferase complex ATPase subunit type 1 TsaE [Demequina sp.]|uniref:tRNA (adenosine(37)-N6)-threonylcarbamoyltransferase complex ATPase subunit type 1 TsaE n=1 Tax=Demequina sp. TaxID=2050685 RepID=UPI0025C611AA|nr:tRNA (adenosine(37)-N6)-threonylcarbamoyltransferase complex ATPase subunit type 1 TsaE [Demequina sp.]
MRALGEALAGVFRAGDLVILSGGLGAGKTTLVQGIGAGLDVRGQVASPTFIISRVHEPRAAGPVLVHVDAYRLGSLEELDHLDLDASTDEAVTVVEWGEGKAEALAEGHALITIDRPRGALMPEEDPAAGDRAVTITTVGDSWKGRAWPVGGWTA